MRQVPQPAVSRMVDMAGHPAVVGVVPGQPDLVALTAASWARAVGAPALYLAYVDTSRYVVEELDDGSVRHAPIDPDTADDRWREIHAELREQLTAALADAEVPWHLVYLAGRPDRALTHLARAVDAAVIVVGTRAPGSTARMREFLEGSVAVHLAHHQHRPVLTVPLSVVDWKDLGAPWR
ncbi:universal stress protein [Georgenia sp. EYE_87]|uniref:universal stress protein n=1 Tax=Georgenia sp. EYE_87 TaxID=2853448 RepID=UPI002004F076|nr:universal stress protein [Georgenia sp. EYE_87]MCK6212024.1 universal stress protein [Georgenia sp. EYE_87]